MRKIRKIIYCLSLIYQMKMRNDRNIHCDGKHTSSMCTRYLKLLSAIKTKNLLFPSVMKRAVLKYCIAPGVHRFQYCDHRNAQSTNV